MFSFVCHSTLIDGCFSDFNLWFGLAALVLGFFLPPPCWMQEPRVSGRASAGCCFRDSADLVPPRPRHSRWEKMEPKGTTRRPRLLGHHLSRTAARASSNPQVSGESAFPAWWEQTFGGLHRSAGGGWKHRHDVRCCLTVLVCAKGIKI